MLLVLKWYTHIRKAPISEWAHPAPQNHPTAGYSHHISPSFSDVEHVSRDALHSLSPAAKLRHTKLQWRSFYRKSSLTASQNPFFPMRDQIRSSAFQDPGDSESWQGRRETEREGEWGLIAGESRFLLRSFWEGKGEKKKREKKEPTSRSQELPLNFSMQS